MSGTLLPLFLYCSTLFLPHSIKLHKKKAPQHEAESRKTNNENGSTGEKEERKTNEEVVGLCKRKT